MKKFAFLVIAAMVAMGSFTACNDEDQDEKLTKDIRNIKNYVGTDSDGDEITATFSEYTFVILYTDPKLEGLTFSGSWKVENEKLILGGGDLEWLPGTIFDKGKKLVFGDGSLIFTLTNK